MKRIEEAAQFIRSKIKEEPTMGFILGSGLGVLADNIEDAVSIPYRDIPHFPATTVAGHSGEAVFGKLGSTSVMMLKGRFHMYEGHEPSTVAFPVRVMKQLGCEVLLVTNAAGGINPDFQSGDLMLITDHLNMMFRNPLVGENDEEIGLRFPDMSDAYRKKWRDVAKQAAKKEDIDLKEGIYVGVLGPSYETPAEIRMFRQLGADAVGMSTVPEVIAANHAGMEVLAISCISNMAAGILDQPLSHEEVMETTDRAKEKFIRLIQRIVHLGMKSK